jgi:hypothetical protein
MNITTKNNNHCNIFTIHTTNIKTAWVHTNSRNIIGYTNDGYNTHQCFEGTHI